MTTYGPGRDREAAPRPVGVLSTADADLDRAAVDFGNQTRRRPRAVLFPATAADVAEIVRYGRMAGIRVVPRGAGHTVDGQALTRDGIVVDLSTLCAVGAPSGRLLSVESGARWRAVVAATLPLGLAPPVLPDYLDLSVGGTLAAGGVGGASHRHGCVADTVADLDVVTPAGDLVTCSPTRDPALFDAVRGTQGAHGVITRATLSLVQVATTVRRHRLTYTDLDAFLADQRRLVDSPRFDHFVGQAVRTDGSWRYVIEAAGPAEASPAGLAAVAVESGSCAYRDFVHRLDPLVDQARATGSWQRDAHPRANVFLPGRHAAATIAGVLRDLAASDLGPGGSVLIYAIPTARLAAPRMPKADDPLTVVFGMQRTAPAGDTATLARMRRANAALHVRARALGGASYSHPAAGRISRLAKTTTTS